MTPLDADRTGYRLVLPPGWVHIPLREGAEEAVDAILRPKFADLPRDRYGPIEAELRKRILAQVAEARRNEGVDLYLPVEQVHGVTIAAGVVVGLLAFSTVETPAAEDVLVALAADAPGARLAEVDGAGAVRTERVLPADPAVDPADPDADPARAFGSRRVDYVVALPGGGDRWISISFSTLGDGDPAGAVADLLVDLFDAVVGTWRWVGES